MKTVVVQNVSSCWAPTTSIREQPIKFSVLAAFKGVADKDIEEVYTPFGHSDYQTIVASIKNSPQGENGGGIYH